MAEEWQKRTELLIGSEKMDRLAGSSVLVVGVGGVGGSAAEMIVRAGVGHLTILDNDEVGETNINRQLPALHSTIGRPKCEVLRDRLMDINPKLDLTVIQDFICQENIDALLGGRHFDYVVDAIDTLSPKVELIKFCLAKGWPLVSSMGAGAKYDATKVRLTDISATKMCPLAHQLRKRLHQLDIYSGFLAVFSEEKPDRSSITLESSRNKKSNVGTISYLPAVFGCVCAQAVICGIAEVNGNL